VKNLVFMRVSGGLPYYNAFLNSSDNASCFHISFSFSAADKAPLPKGGYQPNRLTGGYLCRKAAYRPADDYPSTAYAVPLPLGEGGFYTYNNFTNYAVSICKWQEIIPQDFVEILRRILGCFLISN